MAQDAPDLASALMRINALEAETRRLWRRTLVCLFALLVSVVAIVGKWDDHDEFGCKSLRLYDESGRVRASLSVRGDAVVFDLTDANSKTCAWLTVAGDGDSSLQMANGQNGGARALIGAHSAKPSVHGGRGARPEEAYVWLHAGQFSDADLTAQSGGMGGLELLGENESAASLSPAGLEIQQGSKSDVVGTLRLLDRNGKEVWTAK